MSNYSNLKRCFDVASAIVLLVLLSPIFFLIAMAIIIFDGRPVFFSQERIGRNGERFQIFKFRSMEPGVPNVASADADEIKVTRIGRYTRRTSLDEIPQLLNVLRGEMSFIGPRPALPSQIELLKERERNGASQLRPGITGLAQVAGFDGMSETAKGQIDGDYKKVESPKIDLTILLKTVAFLAKEPPRV